MSGGALDAPEMSDELAHSVRWRVIECGEKKRFWDESTQGFAPPPPRRR
jgi:hypothetical protein